MTCDERSKIAAALRWFGMLPTSEVDICENGQVYVGLTEILPRGSVSKDGEGTELWRR